MPPMQSRDPQQRGTKSHVAASPMPSRGGPNKAGNATSLLHWGIPNAKLGDQSIEGGPQQRGTKSEKAASTLPSQGPKRGLKSYVTPAFAGIPSKGEQNQEWMPHACLPRGPNKAGCLTLLRVPKEATLPLPSPEPKKRRKCYVTPAISGSPTKGKIIKSGYLTTAFSGAQRRPEMLRHACILGMPKAGNKNRIGYLTLAFMGAQTRPKMLCSPCILGVPQQKGAKSEVAASPLPSRGPK